MFIQTLSCILIKPFSSSPDTLHLSNNNIADLCLFKNLSKDVPEEEVNYPASTQSKNRSPDVLPGKDSPALPRKYFNFIFVCLFVFFLSFIRMR